MAAAAYEAVGSSEWDNDKTFTDIYKEADDRMCLKKQEMKAAKKREIVPAVSADK